MSDSNPLHNANTTKVTPFKKLLKVVAIVGVVVVFALIGLVALPVISPSAGAQVADTLRLVIGPQPVADIESFSFQLQDIFNQARYQVVGDKPQISFANTPAAIEPTLAPVPTRPPRSTATVYTSDNPQSGGGAQATLPAPTPTSNMPVPTPTPLPNVVDSSPYIAGGWQTLGPDVAGEPVMARGTIKPDPARPYAYAAIVRIDLSQVDLHLVLGTQEPVAAKGTQPIKRTGNIPGQDQLPNALLVAFNGGFKSIHGNYGVIANGVTVITPMMGIATLAIYRDGSIDLGAWGRDINPSDNLISARQNCPLLVDGGQINPSVNDGSRKEWGYTVKNLDTTWRSGVGISRDGRFLIYAAGNSLTVQTLGQALLTAGAYHAMQLDINGFYTRFAIYRPSSGKSKYPVIADKLLNEMTIAPGQFLDPYDRDFFYVTLHSS
jgi:Phosphodiester glycosidase